MISASQEAALKSTSSRCMIGVPPPKTFNIFSSRITSHQILQVAFTEADICWLPTLSVVPSMLVANKAYVRRMRGNGAC